MIRFKKAFLIEIDFSKIGKISHEFDISELRYGSSPVIANHYVLDIKNGLNFLLISVCFFVLLENIMPNRALKTQDFIGKHLMPSVRDVIIMTSPN